MAIIVNAVTKCDLMAFQWCMSRKCYADVARIAKWVSRLGDGHFYLLAGLLLLLEKEFGMNFFLTALLAFAIELPIYFACKNTVKRHRPADAIAGYNSFLNPSDKFSFPSGHTAAAFMFASIVSSYYPEFAILAYFVASLIGSSRVVLGVHFPTDILAGMGLGLICAEVSLWLIA